MAEGTYEYECMRAELLGIDQPDYEEFMKKKAENPQPPQQQDEDAEAETLRDAELGSESLGRISGGLDELNSILANTQRKINKFKASCGSLTNLLRIKIGQGASSDSPESASGSDAGGSNGTANDDVTGSPGRSQSPAASSSSGNGMMANGERKSDLARALDNHTDRLDAMIDKAENAQYSMAHQTREMKRFLN